MTEERPRWWLRIVVVVVALGGLGWAIVRYSNYQPEPPPNDGPFPITKKAKSKPGMPKVEPPPKE